MKRRQILVGVAALMGAQVAACLPAFAATYAEQIVAQLSSQGFRHIETNRTLLGRIRISADRNDTSREIILNPNTGEILRDLWLSKSGGKSSTVTIGSDDRGGGDNSGKGGGDNSGHGGGDDNDNDDDDDDDDDNSGSGGNSGPGGGSGN
jgi:hypothetical protein